MKNTLCALFVVIFIAGCSKEDNGKIEFFTVRTDHQFYVDGEEIFYDEAYNPAHFGARYMPSKGGKSSVTVDYYTTYDFGVYTSIEERAIEASNLGEVVILDEPIVLKSDGEDNKVYSTYLHDFLSEPFWEITDLDDIEGSSSSEVLGKWARGDNGSYLKVSSSTISLCNSTSLKEFSGIFYPSENKGVLDENGTTLEFYLYLENDGSLRVEQYASNQYLSFTHYYATTSYPCD